MESRIIVCLLALSVCVSAVHHDLSEQKQIPLQQTPDVGDGADYDQSPFEKTITTEHEDSLQSLFADKAAALSCRRLCKFKYVGNNEVIIGTPERPNSRSPVVLKRNNRPVRIIRGGEAQVSLNGGDPTPISDFNPSGLSRPFDPKLFKIFNKGGRRGVGHKELRGNQRKYLNDLCVVLPLKKYVLKRDGNHSNRRTVVSDSSADCVAFRTVVPKMLFELTWIAHEWPHLQVKEPSGFILKPGSSVSPSTGGRHIVDEGALTCDTDSFIESRHTVIYGPNSRPPQGRYNAKLLQFGGCCDGDPNWTIRVYVRGKLIASSTGPFADCHLDKVLLQVVKCRLRGSASSSVCRPAREWAPAAAA